MPSTTASAFPKDSRLVVADFSARSGRFEVIRLPDQVRPDRMAEEVVAGLQSQPQRTIPSTYFYDEAGSLLYERITELAEYYPTRTEAAMLREIAPLLGESLQYEAETGKPSPAFYELVELGSGSSAKTRLLLDAWDAEHRPIHYVPIDVSDSMLRDTAQALTATYRALQVTGIAGQFEEALTLLSPNPHRLFLFLGGTLGNFSPEQQTAFFNALKRRMQPGAQLLLGFDRRPNARKTQADIEAAYNDGAGVTAQFNQNALAHVNHRLGGNFCLEQWRHEAIYNPVAHQIEMYLQSVCPQTVTLSGPGVQFHFEANERILTEISRKFDPEALANWFAKRGYEPMQQWTDVNQRFGLLRLRA